MDCSCIINPAVWVDAMPQFKNETNPKARKEHECYECYRTIKRGENYNKFAGKWDGEVNVYKTCIDCHSLRAAFFCTFVFETLWEELAENFHDSPQLPSHDCMMKLTKKARDKVCDLLEKCWI